ncbi:hypothetical protein JFL43_12135 [Viridibacillus sp. YIM B01967]|uniref:DUF3953 domain-containing protein n=1 Tax=Viridibacillus soli TaxID=2798301 RepID=A0ABS1H850_9BACL|nr:hypothetical protein [Viridibacillus soli]MBK3495586.1 hypothetical protein [Viridibacillus soli]
MKKKSDFIALVCLLFTIGSFIYLLLGNKGMNEFILVGIIQLGVLGTVFFCIKSPKTKLQKIVLWMLSLFSLTFLLFLFTKII